MANTHALVFQTEVARAKPENIVHHDNTCPFCSPETLTDILAKDGDKIWLMNKYRTLQDTWQTVIVESANHEGDFNNYAVTESRAIVRFALAKWQEACQDSRFQSVLMYKNFGPYSGGSLAHPHIQIVGLADTDGYADIRDENFNGAQIWQQDNVTINISDQPIMGFVEFNLRLQHGQYSNTFADAIQQTVKYVLNDYFNGRCTSYNLFFYPVKDDIVVKVVPRFVVSPYFVGFKLAQVDNEARLQSVGKELVTRLNENLSDTL